MKTFELTWRGDSKIETVKGKNIADAMNKAGYGAGALPALDSYKEVEDTSDHSTEEPVLPIKTFKLHWNYGKPEIVKGESIADAVNAAGYGGGAMAALGMWSEVRPKGQCSYHMISRDGMYQGLESKTPFEIGKDYVCISCDTVFVARPSSEEPEQDDKEISRSYAPNIWFKEKILA